MKITADNLTLDEKLILLTGKNSWQTSDINGKIPSISVADGPSGLRKIEDPLAGGGNDEKRNPPQYSLLSAWCYNEPITRRATAMPTLSSIANSWSKEIAYLDGKIIADECVEADVDVLLAPGVNIKKTPLCGRNFEYFSEDPLLTGELAKSFVSGVQDKGVGTCVKHFALNNRETEKLEQSSEVDERTLNEIYLTPFEKVLEANPSTIMCSYNPVNGVYCAENKHLLKDILRDRFKYQGVVVSDWNAVLNRYKSLKATLDLQMPFSKNAYDNLKSAYDNGCITDKEIDDSVNRILNLIYLCKQSNKKVEFSIEQRHRTAVKVATESMVLLKNEDDILPLKSKSVAIGGCAPILGGIGSSMVCTSYKVKPLVEHLKEEMPHVEFLDFGNCIYLDNDGTASHFRRCFVKAYDAETVILAVGNGPFAEGEGYDRCSLKLHHRVEELICKVSEYNKNIIVVLYAGCVVDMSNWIDKVKAVVFAGLLGEGVTEALAKLISGKECFSGKLSETFPKKIEDIPDYDNYMDGLVEWYKEGIFVGYRHYDKFNKEVQFPFGFGLSYADFAYSNLVVKKVTETDYVVSYDITNNSDFDAKEVSQVYVKDVFSLVVRPVKELKAFSKDLIKAKQTITVSHTLSNRAFAYYSTIDKDWYVENGVFEILVGSSSRDIKLKEKIQINLPEFTQHSVLK